jgi:DNA polymerase I-like protein with 3'-5' exonuclease and polymerase domains
VRPIVEVYGAVTGRMAVSDPAVQNIPPALRPCLLADGGKRLVGLDLAQVEPRVAAGMSGDAEMMAAVSSGDVYAAAASVVWPDSAVTPERRALAKRVLLARLYGQGYAALARAIDLSPEDAQDITNRLLRGWPVLRSWMAGLTAKAKAGEKLVTLAGRELPAPPADESYKAVNWVVQGSAADLFYRFTQRVAKKLPASARLWLPLHDELIVECETGDEASVADLLSQVMRCRVGGVEIFGQPTAYGSRWGQKDGAKQQPAAA